MVSQIASGGIQGFNQLKNMKKMSSGKGLKTLDEIESEDDIQISRNQTREFSSNPQVI